MSETEALETRHYIGLRGGMHLSLTYGPATPDKFAPFPPDAPLDIDGTAVYPGVGGDRGGVDGRRRRRRAASPARRPGHRRWRG